MYTFTKSRLFVTLLSAWVGSSPFLAAQPETLSAWSRDGKMVYFQSTSRDISGMNDIYRVAITGGTRSPDELRRLLSLMVGELNASHSGVSAPQGSTDITTGRPGLRFDRVTYENTGRLLITEVVELGSAAIAGRINVGDTYCL